ncbi:Endoplasmic reticulum-Golgi intermediate compartment protein 1, partial [Trichostrongylus colubriformis]
MKCEFLGVDIQDENGRHEVGFVDRTEKIPLEENGCRFKSKFEINKVPGNFHISTHSAASQPTDPDMRHIIHSIRFGDDVSGLNVKGSFNPLKEKKMLSSEPLSTHEYILK